MIGRNSVTVCSLLSALLASCITINCSNLQALKEYIDRTDIFREKVLVAHQPINQFQAYRIFEAQPKTMSRNHESRRFVRCTSLFTTCWIIKSKYFRTPINLFFDIVVVHAGQPFFSEHREEIGC